MQWAETNTGIYLCYFKPRVFYKPFQRHWSHLAAVTEWTELTVQWRSQEPLCRSGPSDVRLLRSLMWAHSVIPHLSLWIICIHFSSIFMWILKIWKLGPGPGFWKLVLTLPRARMLWERPCVWGPRSNNSLFDKIILCVSCYNVQIFILCGINKWWMFL